MEGLDKIIQFSVKNNVLRGSLEIYSEINLAPVLSNVKESSGKLEVIDKLRDSLRDSIVKSVVDLALKHFLDNSRKIDAKFTDGYGFYFESNLHVTPYHNKNPIVIMHPRTEAAIIMAEDIDLEKEE